MVVDTLVSRELLKRFARCKHFPLTEHLTSWKNQTCCFNVHPCHYSSHWKHVVSGTWDIITMQSLGHYPSLLGIMLQGFSTWWLSVIARCIRCEGSISEEMAGLRVLRAERLDHDMVREDSIIGAISKDGPPRPNKYGWLDKITVIWIDFVFGSGMDFDA